jgi:hypothetical protein
MKTGSPITWLCTAAACSALAAAQPPESCGAFESVAGPGQGVSGMMLSAVAAAGPGAFAVGRFYPAGSGAFTPVLLHYDGAAWLEESLPPLGGSATDPVLMSAAMSAATGDSAWIVGYVSVPPTTNNLPLIARWRGGLFDRLDMPALRPQTVYPYGPRAGFAYDAVVLSETDIWVVGQAGGFGDAVTSTVAMALHSSGSGWEDVPTPIVDGGVLVAGGWSYNGVMNMGWIRGYDTADGSLLWQVDLSLEQGLPQFVRTAHPAFSRRGDTAYLTTWFAGNGVGHSYLYAIALGEGAACRADFNNDGLLNSDDFFDFAGAFLTAGADFNSDGLSNSQDFFDFLSAFLTGCP